MPTGIMIVADAQTPNRHKAIGNDHADSTMTSVSNHIKQPYDDDNKNNNSEIVTIIIIYHYHYCIIIIIGIVVFMVLISVFS